MLHACAYCIDTLQCLLRFSSDNTPMYIVGHGIITYRVEDTVVRGRINRGINNSNGKTNTGTCE